MAAAAAWRAARHKTATSLLAAAPTERFEAFVRNWAESDDEPYAARGQTLRARGDYPDLTERPAWPRPAWADELEAHADIIADEYFKASQSVELAPYFGGDYGDDYAGLDIAKQGEIMPGARKQFPETIKALERVSGDDPVGATRLAFFARQGPQSHVPPHSDMVNFLLTCHLGVLVPEDCRLFFTTSRETPPVAWVKSKLAPPLQTSFEHAAFNDSASERVVLFFDVFHPELSREERVALADFELRRRADEAAFWGGGDDRAAPGGDDAASLFAEAARLRREAAEAERDFAPATEATTEAPAARPGLSVVLPIARPDWSVEDTECFFEPRSDGSAQLIKFEVEVPCGVILQESDDAGGRPIVVVGAVGEGSNAEAAGLRPGDILRATSAVRQQMEMPTWQLLGGGIGRPKTFRFIFGADLDAKPARDFEEVLGAVGSNRLDPQGRPAILVVERPA